jgi:Tfp pilus assembly protein PilX
MRLSIINRLRAERGIALPVSLAVLMAVAGLATVAARSGIVSNNKSFRDSNAKRAIQAANAGLQAALYQTNLMQPASAQCVAKDTSTGALSKVATTGGWCAAQSEDLGDGVTYQMQMSSASTTTATTGLILDQRTVVATGIANGVRRRAAVTISASTGNPMFPPGAVIAVRDSVDLMNNASFSGHVLSNGTITIKNNASVCGDIKAGPGKTPKIGNNFTQCAGYARGSLTEPLDLQPVDLSASKASNDNARLTNMKASPQGTPRDTCTGCSNIAWSSSTRVLTINNNGVLNLSGDTYLFCRLEVKSGGKIQIPSRTSPLRLMVDSPENCGGTSGMGSVILDGGFTNLYSPPLAVLIPLAGSPTKNTVLDLPENDSTAPVGIYAPNSTVNMKNNVSYTGAVVAKSLILQNNAHFVWDSSINALLSGSNIRFYQTSTGSYKECTGAPATSTPSDGC